MKTVKILIAIAILSTSFYACKKEEMNIQPGEVALENSNQANIKADGIFDASAGMINIVFNKVGTMIIEGNPNLEKLINMYDASKTAIASANEIFEVTQEETLSITFDRNGKTIASNIPAVPVGSNIDTFINVAGQAGGQRAIQMQRRPSQHSLSALTQSSEELTAALA